MFTIALFGAGKIGDAICGLLTASGRYHVKVCDHSLASAEKVAAKWGKNTSAHALVLDSAPETKKILKDCAAVVSALPFFCNVSVATLAREADIHYLDLTEDVETTRAIKEIAKGATKGFLPQCGLAPGFISISANYIANLFEEVESIKMRVGALPLFPSNQLKYNLTWSTEGLINEYGNICELIESGKKTSAFALEGLETFSLDGVIYEAFNTSGGLGTLCETWAGKVKDLNYKSIRYPGHRNLIAFLMEDLKFDEHRDELKAIFERSIPTTTQDKCLVFVEVIGRSKGKYQQRTYASTVYNSVVHGTHLSAIQITTASGICAPLDLLLTGQLKNSQGFLRCEDIAFPQFLNNEFGWFYKDEKAMSVLL